MSKDNEADTKKLMGALVRIKPKPHEEMKIGKRVSRAAKRPKNGRTAVAAD
jgi:hypothetical protein